MGSSLSIRDLSLKYERIKTILLEIVYPVYCIVSLELVYRTQQLFTETVLYHRLAYKMYVSNNVLKIRVFQDGP